jgi:hypothetical protein
VVISICDFNSIATSAIGLMVVLVVSLTFPIVRQGYQLVPA